jgi:hypothetical protein
METVRIWDGKKSDPGSGKNIPDPPHWQEELWILIRKLLGLPDPDPSLFVIIIKQKK